MAAIHLAVPLLGSRALCMFTWLTVTTKWNVDVMTVISSGCVLPAMTGQTVYCDGRSVKGDILISFSGSHRVDRR